MNCLTKLTPPINSFIMNRIQLYALENGKINSKNLAYVLDELSAKKDINVDFILSLILGLENVPEELPKHAILNDGKRRSRLKEYRLLDDMVCYEYNDELTLYFKTKEDADKFSAGQSHYNMNYKYSSNDEFRFEGTKKYETTGYCFRQEWLDNAVK